MHLLERIVNDIISANTLPTVILIKMLIANAS